MNAIELIKLIKGMNDFERTEFGQALADCGVVVMITRKLGSARKVIPTITGVELGEGETKVGKGQAYDIPQGDGPYGQLGIEPSSAFGRKPVPHVKSIKEYEGTKKGSPLEE